MTAEQWLTETCIAQTVNYLLEVEGGKFLVIENVPARVCLETGERLFSPETVERLQRIAWTTKKPARVVETPVFEFSESFA